MYAHIDFKQKVGPVSHPREGENPAERKPAVLQIALTGRWVTSKLNTRRPWPTSRKTMINLKL